MSDSWEKKVSGDDCPMENRGTDFEKHYYFVRKFASSTLYLNRNQTYRGYCVLVYDTSHVTRIDQLSVDDWTILAKDIHKAEIAVYKTVQPDHINVANLGMVVPHLHWHIIPRYKSDPRWGGPIWTADLADMDMQLLKEQDYRQIAGSINHVLDTLN